MEIRENRLSVYACMNSLEAMFLFFCFFVLKAHYIKSLNVNKWFFLLV